MCALVCRARRCPSITALQTHSRDRGDSPMARLCEGRVVIVTGAGRGIGREHALMLAAHGAKVVVNDLGGEPDGTGADLTPAQQVAAEIAGMGGDAIVNGDDVSDFAGAKRMIDQAIDAFGTLDILINN